jgi:hypothetical protein
MRLFFRFMLRLFNLARDADTFFQLGQEAIFDRQFCQLVIYTVSYRLFTASLGYSAGDATKTLAVDRGCYRTDTCGIALTPSERLHQAPLHAPILRRDNLQCETRILRTRSTSRSVDVGIGGTREVEVDDVVDGGNVKTARGDVGGYQGAILARLESGYQPL